MTELIGGILVDGEIRRNVTLAALDGAGEMAVAELAGAALSQPERVSAFLAATVAEVGGRPFDLRAAAALSVGDRQYLARLIGIAMTGDLVWLTSICSACATPFDIPVHQSALPVKPAGGGYPETVRRVGGRSMSLRVPTGVDQAAVAGMDEAEGAEALFARLATPEDGVEWAPTPEMREALETAIEDMAPEVALEAEADCPACGARNRTAVDPYLGLAMAGSGIFDDIHVLASLYHWSEREILALPRARRLRYLGLIDRARGMVSGAVPGAIH